MSLMEMAFGLSHPWGWLAGHWGLGDSPGCLPWKRRDAEENVPNILYMVIKHLQKMAGGASGGAVLYLTMTRDELVSWFLAPSCCCCLCDFCTKNWPKPLCFFLEFIISREGVDRNKAIQHMLS